MKKILAVILLLVLIPLCLVVWAGLDATGGSLINCRLIQSDTSLLTLWDNVAIGGNLTVTNNDPMLLINDNLPTPEVSFLVFSREYVSRAHLKWDEPNSVLIIESVGKVKFGEDVQSVFIDNVNHQMGVGTDAPGGLFGVKSGGSIGMVTFTGSGLDDATAGGTLTGTRSTDISYKVEIDSNGTPDTFKWTDAPGFYWRAEGVAITGSAQTLNHGMTVTFGATDGHTTGDYWTWTVKIYNPFYLWDADGNIVMYVGNDGRVGILDETPSYPLDVDGIIAGNFIYAGNGSEGDPGITFASEPAAGMYLTGAGRTIGFSIDGTNVLQITDSDPGLIVDTDSVRIMKSKTPASAVDIGTEGDICWDSEYVYVCVATDSWKRSPLSSWGVPDFLLLETGDYLLLETGDKLIKEY